MTRAQLRREVRYFLITSGDGFHESVDLDLIASDERTMLCYVWYSHPPPAGHGFPLNEKPRSTAAGADLILDLAILEAIRTIDKHKAARYNI